MVPDLSGVWGRNTIDFTAPEAGKGPVKNISGSRNIMVGDYNDPMLKPWAAEIIKHNGEIARTGDAFPTAHNQCWPEPPPYILGNQQLQVLQQKDQVTLMYSHSSQVRRVRLNAKHPAEAKPSWYGDLVGHYEHGTLVVDTIGYRNRTAVHGGSLWHASHRRAACRRAFQHGRPVARQCGAAS